MKRKNLLITVLLLIAILLSACTKNSQPPQSSEALPPESTVESLTEEPLPDPFQTIRESKERWLTYGLSAYENKKPIKNLKDFFAEPQNMLYLTLYNDMFVFDQDQSALVAEALFDFIYNQYGAEALLDVDQRCAYKTAYLQSLGLDIEYLQMQEVESFLASMECSSNATYQYIISFDNVTYYFKDFSAGTPSQYHGLFYYSTTGLFEMIDYLKSNHLGDQLNTDRKFHYFLTFDGTGYSKTLANGAMYINESYSTLHEAVHAMGVTHKDHIWLSEGICNYFGKALGFQDQIAGVYIQILNMVKQGYFDEAANAGDQRSILYKRIYEDYIRFGGKMDTVDHFDFRLYANVVAKAELDTGAYRTIGDAYKLVNKTDCDAIGAELSYDQTTSLIFYLADTYGIEKVMEAYHTQDVEAVFEKNYEALKAEWLSQLQ